MSTPRLRFKDEDGRDFPEWKSNPLSDLAKIYDGTHMTPDYKNEGVPFYSVEHLTSNNFSNTKFISEEVFDKESRRVKLEKGDILMTKIGDIGTPRYINWDVRASFYVSLALLKQSKKINSLFLSHYIRTNSFQKELHQRIIHVAFPKKINLGEIGNCLVIRPADEKEQTKIANFLTAVDEKITQLTQKTKLLAQYKKGVMQHIFSQELRFKDDDGLEFSEWGERALGDVCISLDNLRKPLNDAERQLMKGNIPYWGANNIMDYVNDYIFDETIVLLAEDGGNFNEYKTRPIANISHGKCWVNNHTHVLKGKDGLLNVFLFYSLVHKNITGYVSGGTRAKLTKGEMLKILIDVPSKKEQTKIANFLTAIDDKITNTQAQLAAVKQYKQGLLQQMFI